jgi:hypothetical protein
MKPLPVPPPPSPPSKSSCNASSRPLGRAKTCTTEGETRSNSSTAARSAGARSPRGMIVRGVVSARK